MSEGKRQLEELQTQHGTYKTTFNAMYRRRKKWEPSNPKHLLTHIPGTVVAINVAVGQQVKAGDELMMYKAMKMDNRVKSPIAGTIKKIDVQVGDKLPKGHLMIEFE